MTGDVEFGAQVAMEAIKNKKHFVSFNAELFGTLGSILKKYADEAGVIFTLADGDQPVVEMNLYRFVKGLGVKPVLCGNIKGLHDPYRNPTTQEEFAKKWGQNVEMVTSFADGSKISFEQAVVANATGMGVGKRGMHGPTVESGTLITESVNWYPEEQLLNGNGIVDYVVGAVPGPGVYVLGTIDDPTQKHYLNLYKLGEGPFYCFYTPYHLCHFEVPNTIARAVIFEDTALAPLGKPYVDVVATAKKDLKKGEVIDGIGGYMTFGLCENYDTARKENLLHIGLAQGCILKRDIAKDTVLTFEDVELPNNRLSNKLWNEQVNIFS
jgi:predicted homoserine dehydrogenase-like protein